MSKNTFPYRFYLSWIALGVMILGLYILLFIFVPETNKRYLLALFMALDLLLLVSPIRCLMLKSTWSKLNRPDIPEHSCEAYWWTFKLPLFARLYRLTQQIPRPYYPYWPYSLWVTAFIDGTDKEGPRVIEFGIAPGYWKILRQYITPDPELSSRSKLQLRIAQRILESSVEHLGNPNSSEARNLYPVKLCGSLIPGTYCIIRVNNQTIFPFTKIYSPAEWIRHGVNLPLNMQNQETLEVPSKTTLDPPPTPEEYRQALLNPWPGHSPEETIQRNRDNTKR